MRSSTSLRVAEKEKDGFAASTSPLFSWSGEVSCRIGRCPRPSAPRPPFASSHTHRPCFPPPPPRQCLVEVVAAIKHGLPIVMKTGRLAGRRFEADMGMTQALVNIVDVAQAEAAVADDRDRILTMVRDEWGGFDALNAKGILMWCDAEPLALSEGRMQPPLTAEGGPVH